MHHHTIAEIVAALKEKKFSSEEITQVYLKRIKDLDPGLNSFITVTPEQALTEARAADVRLASNTASLLTGVPIAHKDIFCTLGTRTTAGSKILDNFISPYDATVVARFKENGVVLLGKTNMDEFAMGSSNENSFYGPVKNPWNTECVPGGSSGGSAAAVAACLTPGATGTDTGGSIRQPSALCNLTGIKPTYGRVSRYGMIAFASSLDQAGPMTRTAEDAALLLSVMAGFDTKDSTSIDEPVPDYAATLNNSLEGLKIGLPQEYFTAALDPRINAVIEIAIREYEKMGAKIQTVSLPNIALSAPAYYVIAPAEASSNLERFDGVRYGYRCENPVDLEDLYQRSRSEGFGPEVKRRILMGTYVLSTDYYDSYYLKSQKIRSLIAQDFQNVFKDVDVLLSPATPASAFKLNEKVNDPINMYLSDIYTVAANLAGLPAIAFPAGFIDALPVGMQLMGKHFDEARLLNIAHRYQQVSDWHLQLPPKFK